MTERLLQIYPPCTRAAIGLRENVVFEGERVVYDLELELSDPFDGLVRLPIYNLVGEVVAEPFLPVSLPAGYTHRLIRVGPIRLLPGRYRTGCFIACGASILFWAMQTLPLQVLGEPGGTAPYQVPGELRTMADR